MTTRKREKTSPTPTANGKELLVNSNVSSDVKELSFEDTSLQFKNADGKWRISLRQISEYYDIVFSKSVQKITTNRELFMDLGADTVTVSANGSAFDYNLSIRDAVTFLGLLNYKRYDDTRRNKLIGMRKWLSDNAEKILTGETPQLLDLGSLKDDPKSIQGDNGLRRALFVKKVNEAHPTSPNTVKRLHALSHNDQALVRGPHVPFEAGAHKRYTKELALKDSAQKMVSFAAIACGKIEIDDINRFEREVFKGLPEKYIPDHLPGMIEPTKQTKLLCEANS